MGQKIRCFTTFDITTSGIANRRMPYSVPEEDRVEWERKRKTQCNFDTIIQILSLRCQPEDITQPKPFRQNNIDGWSFKFAVNMDGVYDKPNAQLGALYDDCDGVPMISDINDDNFLSRTNIYFEIINDET